MKTYRYALLEIWQMIPDYCRKWHYPHGPKEDLVGPNPFQAVSASLTFVFDPTGGLTVYDANTDPNVLHLVDDAMLDLAEKLRQYYLGHPGSPGTTRDVNLERDVSVYKIDTSTGEVHVYRHPGFKTLDAQRSPEDLEQSISELQRYLEDMNR